MPDSPVKLRRPATLDHLRKKEPLSKWVPIVLNDDATEAVAEARRSLIRAEETFQKTEEGSPECEGAQRMVDEAKIALEDALSEQDEHVVWMRFQSIGRKAYDRLADEHPPTDEEKEEAEKKDLVALYNAKTFLPALVAASCVEPRMSVDEVQDLIDTWNNAEVMPLYNAAMEVNMGRRVAELGNASGGTLG